MPVDKSDMLTLLNEYPKYIRESITLTQGITPRQGVDKIVVIGSGTANQCGELLSLFLEKSAIPVISSSILPSWVDSHTLVFAISYSGNTEMVIDAIEEAKRKNADIIGVCSGGKVAEICPKVIKIPHEAISRLALPYLFFPLMGVLYNGRMVAVKNEEINELLALLIKNNEEVHARAKEFCKALENKNILVFSSARMSVIAHHAKTAFNQTSKAPAFYGTFPETIYEDLSSFEGMQRASHYVIFIDDHEDNPRIKQAMTVAKSLMERTVTVSTLSTRGVSLMARIFYTMNFFDILSYHLAMRKRVDPSITPLVEEVKVKMR